MYLENFLSTLTLKDTGIITDNPHSAIVDIFTHLRQYDGVSINYSTSFIVNNISFMQVVNGMNTFSVPISGTFPDIVYDITSNVDCEILLNGITFNANTPLVVCNGQYTEKLIRFYIDPDNVPSNINLNYKIISLNFENRKRLMSIPILYAGESLCSNGVISRR